MGWLNNKPQHKYLEESSDDPVVMGEELRSLQSVVEDECVVTARVLQVPERRRCQVPWSILAVHLIRGLT